ncbi:MAG: hypothetical protein Q9210_005239 [Variospora velana]
MTAHQYGRKATAAFLEKALAAETYDDQQEIVDQYFDEMQQRGYTLDTPDLESIIKHEPIRRAWMERQRARGREELGRTQTYNKMEERETKRFLNLFRLYSDEIEQWEKKKDQEDIEIEEHAQTFHKLLMSNPHLAKAVLNNEKITAIIETALDELKANVKRLEEEFEDRVFGLTQAIEHAAEAKQLSETFERRVTEMQDAMDVNDVARGEAEQASEDLRAELKTCNDLTDSLKHDIDRLSTRNSHLDEQVTYLKEELSQAEKVRDRYEGDRNNLRMDKSRIINERDSLVTELDVLFVQRDGLLAEEANLTTERDSLLAERESLVVDLDMLSKDRENLIEERDGLVVERNCLVIEFHELSTERDGLLAEEANLTAERDSLLSMRDALADNLDELYQDRNDLIKEREGLTVEKEGLLIERHNLVQQRSDLQDRFDTKCREAEDLRKANQDVSGALEQTEKELALLRSSSEREKEGLENRLKQQGEEAAENAKKAAETHALDLDIRDEVLQESDARCETLEQKNAELMTKLKTAEDRTVELVQEVDSAKVEQQDSHHRIEQAGDTVNAARHLLGQYVGEVTGIRLAGNNLLDIMLQQQAKSFERLTLNSDSDPQVVFQRCTPRMTFETEGPALTPVTHAMNLWLATHSDTSWFKDSQALFNADIADYHSKEVYFWVSKALDAGIPALENVDPTKPNNYKKTLTLLQGIAFLSSLAQLSQHPLDDVRGLLERLKHSLGNSNLLGAGSVIGLVFSTVKSSVESGDPIESWVTAPTSTIEVNQRLDGSNSAVGVNRCIIADAVTPGNFILIDQIGINEVLYHFCEQEVDRLDIGDDDMLRLMFLEHPVLLRSGHEFSLQMDVALDQHVCQWVETFMVSKI